MEYLEIRQKMIMLNTKIFKQDMNDTNYITKAAKCLGLKSENNNIYFYSESEQESFWDFMTYEEILGNNSLFNNAISNSDFSKTDIQFLNKYNVFETALYIIKANKMNEIEICNIETNQILSLYDINLAKENLNNGILFTRIINIGSYFMTSGFSYLFLENIDTVINRAKILKTKEFCINHSVTRFRVMLKLNRMYGKNVKYKNN